MLILVGCFYSRYIKSQRASRMCDFYTTGMTVVLMPLDCLLHCESVTTQLARSTPTAVKAILNLNEFNCTTDVLINIGRGFQL